MRNPELLVKVENIYKDEGKTILDMPRLDYFDKLQYDLLDSKDFTRYIRAIEFTVRNSFEYKYFIEYLKNTEGMNVCSFLTNVTSADNRKVRIEIHHEPFTLYDICLAVFKRRQANKQDTRVESVAEEVMYLHWIGMVGLIPLSVTIHELIHNNFLFVPCNKVRGNYRAFRDAYYNYIEPETLDLLDALELATLEYNGSQMGILNKHDIYINSDGSINLPRKDYIVNIIKNRIDTIKNNKIVMAKIVNKNI